MNFDQDLQSTKLNNYNFVLVSRWLILHNPGSKKYLYFVLR